MQLFKECEVFFSPLRFARESNRIKEIIVEAIFPIKCFNCGNENGEFLCEDCFSLIEIIEQRYCHICKKRKSINIFQCEKCENKTSLFHLFFATTYNEKREDILIKRLIHYFKYGPLIKQLSPVFCQLIIAHFRAIDTSKDFFKNFLIIPIPLYIKREKWRGFNQAEEIAKHLSSYLEIPIIKKLIRVKNTKPQTETENREKRKTNIKNAFKCSNSSSIKGKNILLIDDIYTSGATMEEAAQTLKKAGAKRIWGCVVALG